MDTELEIQRLLSRVQELERENAILRKQLAALKSCDSLQKGIASAHHAAATFVNSKEALCTKRGLKESKIIHQSHLSKRHLRQLPVPALLPKKSACTAPCFEAVLTLTLGAGTAKRRRKVGTAQSVPTNGSLVYVRKGEFHAPSVRIAS